MKAVLAQRSPAATLQGSVKDHAGVINESLRKIILSYCCLCFCIMDDGRNEEWVKGVKSELCTFFGSVVDEPDTNHPHAAVLLFIYPSVSLSAPSQSSLYVHSCDLPKASACVVNVVTVLICYAEPCAWHRITNKQHSLKKKNLAFFHSTALHLF